MQIPRLGLEIVINDRTPLEGPVSADKVRPDAGLLALSPGMSTFLGTPCKIDRATVNTVGGEKPSPARPEVLTPHNLGPQVRQDSH